MLKKERKEEEEEEKEEEERDHAKMNIRFHQGGKGRGKE